MFGIFLIFEVGFMFGELFVPETLQTVSPARIPVCLLVGCELGELVLDCCYTFVKVLPLETSSSYSFLVSGFVMVIVLICHASLVCKENHNSYNLFRCLYRL